VKNILKDDKIELGKNLTYFEVFKMKKERLDVRKKKKKN
jgi:hypothetical protein